MLEKMIDDIIKKYGFESPTTINFCKVACEETVLYTSWLYSILMRERHKGGM